MLTERMVHMTFEVHARRWDGGWELHISENDVTQAHSLSEAESVIRDYLAVEHDVEPGSFEVRIVPEIDGLEDEAAQLRRDIGQLQDTQLEVAARSRALAQRLRERGLSGADTAAVLGVSPQRVSQLLKAS
jgi:DNA-directed RNA polymerase specialized sigma subunit